VTRTQARQRARYKALLLNWELGTWSPPPEWLQMVANRFPDLLEQTRDRVLGKDEAERLRAKRIDAMTPKVGAEYFAKDGAVPMLVVAINGHRVSVVKSTRWNRIKLRLRLAFSRVAGLFTRTEENACQKKP